MREVFEMPRYYFRIAHGNYSGTSDVAFDLKSDEEAWREMTKVCGDLVSGITRALKPNSDWQMDLLDEGKNPLYRIRLLAEKLI
jgi:hypothetical protein